MSKHDKLADMKLDLILFVERLLEFQKSYNVADKQYFDLLCMLLENVRSFIDTAQLLPPAPNAAIIDVLTDEVKSGVCALCGENFKLPARLFEEHLEMCKQSQQMKCSSEINSKPIENGDDETLINHPKLILFPVPPVLVPIDYSSSNIPKTKTIKSNENIGKNINKLRFLDINSFSPTKHNNDYNNTTVPTTARHEQLPNTIFTLPVLKIVKSSEPKTLNINKKPLSEIIPLSMSQLLNHLVVNNVNFQSTITPESSQSNAEDISTTEDSSYFNCVDQCTSSSSSNSSRSSSRSKSINISQISVNSNKNNYASDISLISSCDIVEEVSVNIINNNNKHDLNNQINNPFKMPLPSEVIGFRQTFPILD